MTPGPMTFFAAILGLATYSYTYTVELHDASLAWYVATSMISAGAWIILAILIHKFRTRAWEKGIEGGDGDRAIVFRWIKPLTLALKAFCTLSAARYIANVVDVVYDVDPIQNVLFFVTNLALAVAVGYASVYYKRIPDFLVRIRLHQINSRRFEQIADSAIDSFLEIDTLSNIWYANRAAAEMFGYLHRKELLGRNITELMPIQFREKHLLGIERYLQTGESNIIGKREPLRLQAQRANGQEFPIELTLARYDVGEATRFCAIIRDISYKVKLEQEVKESAG